MTLATTNPLTGEKKETFLTIQALAERWDIAEQTIRSRRSRGDNMPPSFNIGNRVRYRLSDVEAWESEQMSKAVA